MESKILKKLKSLIVVLIALAVVLLITSCSSKVQQEDKYQVVATTTMLADLAKVLGGEQVVVSGLMGPGIDPHLYKASAGDVTLMQNADLIVYNGLHLEGKMGEIFENLTSADKHIVKIANGLPESSLIADESGGVHDPHIWFDVMLWKSAADNLYEGLIKLDPDHKETYQKNYESYQNELDSLHNYVLEQIEKVPERSRVLVTAHDAFAYFGQAYGFEVMGLQGISTTSEAGTGDVKELADFITENKIKAIFVESSVPRKNIEALQEAVLARGFNVEIGGELYSDSLGSDETDTGTYLGTVKANINTIVNALK